MTSSSMKTVMMLAYYGSDKDTITRIIGARRTARFIKDMHKITVTFTPNKG